MRVAIIDLGTNSIRLFIFECLKKKCELIVREKMMVRLGDSVFETGKLEPEAMKRTVKAFKHFRDLVEDYGVDETRCVATSALREAKNTEKFRKKVLKKSGFSIDVISGLEEARLIGIGVTRNVPLPNRNVVLIDMGGGSTEISLCKGDTILSSNSLPIGAARGQQLFLKTVPPEAGGERELRRHVNGLIDECFPQLPFKTARLAVGTSGSIRAFGRIYEFNTQHAKVFTRRFVRDAVSDLSQYSRKEMKSIPGLEAKRVDLILAAGIILHQILLRFDVHKVQVTKYALTDGILATMVQSE